MMYFLSVNSSYSRFSDHSEDDAAENQRNKQANDIWTDNERFITST